MAMIRRWPRHWSLRPRFTITLAVLLALLGILLAAALRPASAPPANHAATPEPLFPRPSPPPAAPPAQPLAPLTGPLRDRLPALQQLAEHGHGEAACVYALELSRCRASAVRHELGLAFGQVLQQRSLSLAAVDSDQALIDGIAGAREQHAAQADLCAGIEAHGGNPAVIWVQNAAARGPIRWRVISALMQPDGSLPRLPRGTPAPLELDPAVTTLVSQFYADHALLYLQQGFQAGDPLALEGLLLVHAPDVLPLSGNADALMRLPNPRLFAALALLAERLYGSEMLGNPATQLLQTVWDGLDPSARDRLLREVEFEVRRWQAAGPPPVASDDVSDLCRAE